VCSSGVFTQREDRVLCINRVSRWKEIIGLPLESRILACVTWATICHPLFLPQQQRIYTLSHSKHTSWNLLEYCFVLSALSVNADDVKRKINNDKEKRNCQKFCTTDLNAFIQSSIAIKWINLLNKVKLSVLFINTNSNANDLFQLFNYQK